MRILIIGASRGTGALSVQEALRRGHTVTAFSRNHGTLPADPPQLARFQGDFHRQESVRAAVPGHDAVIITASAPSLRAFKQNPRYFSDGTQLVIEAMREHGVRRLVILSALGAGESKQLMNPLLRAVVRGLVLKLPFADHDRQEELVRASGLQWVIVRPGRLTNGAARRRYVKDAELAPVPSSISRADVADFLIECAETASWVQKAVQIGGS